MKQVSAKDLEIESSLIKGKEKHGLSYFLWHDSSSVGGQCSNCHTVVWVNSRADKVLSEVKPPHIADSGEEYRNYYQTRIQRFLSSLPACPVCNSITYDRFINNVNFPRFSDGTECTLKGDEQMISPEEKVMVWYAG